MSRLPLPNTKLDYDYDPFRLNDKSIAELARACGLRRSDLEHLRRGHILDHHSDGQADTTFSVTFVRRHQRDEHIIPVLKDHQFVVTCFLDLHLYDNKLWVPVVPPTVNCDATRRYYAQQQYLNLCSRWGKKSALTQLAAILEEPRSQIVERYDLRRCRAISPQASDQRTFLSTWMGEVHFFPARNEEEYPGRKFWFF